MVLQLKSIFSSFFQYHQIAIFSQYGCFCNFFVCQISICLFQLTYFAFHLFSVVLIFNTYSKIVSFINWSQSAKAWFPKVIFFYMRPYYLKPMSRILNYVVLCIVLHLHTFSKQKTKPSETLFFSLFSYQKNIYCM